MASETLKVPTSTRPALIGLKGEKIQDIRNTSGSKAVTVQCGWTIHGVFCNCPGVIVEPVTAGKKKVT